MRYALLFILIAFPAAAADDRATFYGTWGTAKQCARTPLKPGGTVLAAPFEINSQWLKHGNVWCRLNWFPIQPREDGAFTGARAQCGEDSIRDYFLRMERSGKELTLRWGLLLSNGPLVRCPIS